MRPLSNSLPPRPTGFQKPCDQDPAQDKRQRPPAPNPMDDVPVVDAPPLFGPSALPGCEALGRLDGLRVCTTALSGTLSSGSVFAASFSLGAVLRSQARPPGARALGCLLPMLGGALTAPNERAVAALTGLRATEPRERDLRHAAILPGVLWLVHAALRPAHPAASAAASLLGTALGSGLAEAAAQLSLGDEPASRAAGDPAHRRTGQVAMGRALSLLPFTAYAAHHSVRGTRPHPLAALGVAAAGYALREALVPCPTQAPA